MPQSPRKKTMLALIESVPNYEIGAKVAEIPFDTLHQLETWRDEFSRYRYELKSSSRELYEASRWLTTKVYSKSILLGDDQDILKLIIFKKAPREPRARPTYIEEI